MLRSKWEGHLEDGTEGRGQSLLKSTPLWSGFHHQNYYLDEGQCGSKVAGCKLVVKCQMSPVGDLPSKSQLLGYPSLSLG